MNKNAILIILAGIIALASGVYFQHSDFFNQEKPSHAALQFSLPDTSDKTRDVTEWRGKILIINFWATWCPPCRDEIPEFIKLQNEFRNQGLQFIGIAIENKQPVLEYLKTININYPVLIGGEQAIALSHQLGNIINAVPFTVVVNQQGQIIYRHPGEISREKILDTITPLVNPLLANS